MQLVPPSAEYTVQYSYANNTTTGTRVTRQWRPETLACASLLHILLTSRQCLPYSFCMFVNVKHIRANVKYVTGEEEPLKTSNCADSAVKAS